MSVEFLYPLALLLLLGALLALYFGLTGFDPASRVRKRWMFALRTLVIAGVALDVAGLLVLLPGRQGRVCTYFLVDISESLSAGNLEDASRFLRESLGSRRRDSLAGLITLAGSPVLEQRALKDADPERFVDQIQQARKRKVKGAEGRSNTNLESAVDLAVAAFPEGYARRVVLLSDMNESAGDVVAAAERAAASGVEVDVVPLDRSRDPEILVGRLELPAAVKLGESFKVTAYVRANQPCPVVARLYRNGYLVQERGNSSQPLLLAAGETPIPFRQSLDAGGRHLYGVKLEVVDPNLPDDPANNTVYGFTEAKGAPRVLLLGEREEDMEPLAEALRPARYEVEVRDVFGVPQTILDLENFDAVVFGDIPASRLQENQLKLFRDYVHDFGGGFVMVGGRNSFGPGGYAGTPIEELLPVTIRLTEKQSPSLAIVLVADTSRSMLYLPDAKESAPVAEVERVVKSTENVSLRQALDALLKKYAGQPSIPGRELIRIYDQWGYQRGDDGLAVLKDRLELARLGGIDKAGIIQRAITLILDRLTEKDYVGAVSLGSYDREPYWILPMQKVMNREAAQKQIRTLRADTFSEALGSFQMAETTLAATKAAYRHIMLLSDGYLSRGHDFSAFAAQMAADGLTVSTVGIGEGANVEFLKKMARWGNGRFYWVKQESDVAGMFTRELDEFRLEAISEGPVKPEKVRDHEALQGVDIDLAPYLFGYVRTYAKLDARTPLALPPEMDPLLAFGDFGAGRTAAFTSDVKHKWAESWIKDWPRGFSTLWAQVIRSTIRSREGDQLSPDIAIDGHRISLAVDGLGEDGRFLSELDATCDLFYLGRQGRVFSSSARTMIPLRLTAPGRYSAEQAVDKDGVYLARFHALPHAGAPNAGSADSESAAKKPIVRVAGFIVSSSKEAAHLEANRDLADTVAAKTHGTVGRDAAVAFRPAPRTSEPDDWGYGCLILAGVLFVLDCLVRRWPAIQLLLARWRQRAS